MHRRALGVHGEGGVRKGSEVGADAFGPMFFGPWDLGPLEIFPTERGMWGGEDLRCGCWYKASSTRLHRYGVWDKHPPPAG